MNLLSLFHKVDKENRRSIFNLIEPNPAARILDLGCGDGSFALQVAECAGSKDVWGVDFLDNMCQVARKKGVNACCADLNGKFPFENESFDVVHANQVIEHLIDTDNFVREIHRILKPDGYSIISTPNLASLHNIFSLFLGKQPFSAHISNEVILGNSFDPKQGLKHESKGTIHIRIFAPEALKELFEYNGLKVEQFIGAGYYPFPGKIAAVLSKIDRTHAVYITMKARKQRRSLY